MGCKKMSLQEDEVSCFDKDQTAVPAVKVVADRTREIMSFGVF